MAAGLPLANTPVTRRGCPPLGKTTPCTTPGDEGPTTDETLTRFMTPSSSRSNSRGRQRGQRSRGRTRVIQYRLVEVPRPRGQLLFESRNRTCPDDASLTRLRFGYGLGLRRERP
jgi:hypothetical protein